MDSEGFPKQHVGVLIHTSGRTCASSFLCHWGPNYYVTEVTQLYIHVLKWISPIYMCHSFTLHIWFWVIFSGYSFKHFLCCYKAYSEDIGRYDIVVFKSKNRWCNWFLLSNTDLALIQSCKIFGAMVLIMNSCQVLMNLSSVFLRLQPPRARAVTSDSEHPSRASGPLVTSDYSWSGCSKSLTAPSVPAPSPPSTEPIAHWHASRCEKA